LQAAKERKRQALYEQDMMNQNDEGISEVPCRRGFADRVRGVFVRGQSSVDPAQTDGADEDVWARERERQDEADQHR
jgi:hypothetical protein